MLFLAPQLVIDEIFLVYVEFMDEGVLLLVEPDCLRTDATLSYVIYLRFILFVSVSPITVRKEVEDRIGSRSCENIPDPVSNSINRN